MLPVVAAFLGCWQHQQHRRWLGLGLGGPAVVLLQQQQLGCLPLSSTGQWW
jgi:hypothetical protein